MLLLVLVLPLNAFSLLWLRLDNFLLQRFVSIRYVLVSFWLVCPDSAIWTYIHPTNTYICIWSIGRVPRYRTRGTWRGVLLFANWFTIVYGCFCATVIGLFFIFFVLVYFFVYIFNEFIRHSPDKVYRSPWTPLLFLPSFQLPKLLSVRAIIIA